MAVQKVISVVAVAVIAGAAWMVYGRAVESPFTFDDAVSVVKNPSIRSVWPLVGDAADPGPLNPPKDITTSGRPLVNLSLALNYRFGRLDPGAYHVFNIFVHVLSALLLMAIVQRTLCLDYFEGKFEQASGPLSFIVGLLWTLHPLQTETVVYVTQRTELMVGFFYLATLYASLHYWSTISSSGRRIWLSLATVACLAGMASKEVMVTAPVMVLLFERTFVARTFWRALKNSWPLYVGLFLSWVLLLYLNYGAPRADSAGFRVAREAGLPAYAWWLTQMKVLLLYLKLTVWPWPLSIHYEMPYFMTPGLAWPWLAPVVLLGIISLVLVWRRSAIGFVGAWVFVILSPTLVVPILTEVAAERRMYLPLAALITLVVVAVYSLAQKSAPPRQWPVALAGIVALLLAVVWSIVSVNRLAAYHDDLTLWQDNLMHQPDDAISHNNLGNALHEAGRLQEAIDHYNTALQLNPRYYPAHNNLGAILNEMGQPQAAIPHFEETLRLKPDSAEAHNNLGLALANTNRYREAIAEYGVALQLDRDYPDAHFNLSLALRSIGQPQEAVTHCLEALRFVPNAPKTWANLAMAYAELNRSAEAIAAAEKALALARSQGQTALAAGLEAWLKSEREREPKPSDAAPQASQSAP